MTVIEKHVNVDIFKLVILDYSISTTSKLCKQDPH